MTSGSWERPMYDADNYASNLDTNNRRINIIMDNPGVCTTCRVPEPGMLGKVGVSVQPDRPMIDIESDLMQIGRRYTRGLGYKPDCPELKMTNEGSGYPCGTGVSKGEEASQIRLNHLPECSFGQIDSRTVTPPCTLRGTGWDRWSPVCRNPVNLATIEFPGETNVNYRMVVKDNFVSCKLRPWDQTSCLPKGGEIPCMKINGQSCSAFTGELQPDRYTNPYPVNHSRQTVTY